MFVYKTGDLLCSGAVALVNPVNCEGIMGKGLAYQFKKKFPETYIDYSKVCKAGKLTPGQLHYHIEKEKIIINLPTEKEKIIVNFPTKSSWREKSKMEYIEKGLDALILLIKQLNIKSIAIPPLGCGNGGLVWGNVKDLIISKLGEIASDIDIYLYAPSSTSSSMLLAEPQLDESALILMEIKQHLSIFNTDRLQKAAFFTDLFSRGMHFDFRIHDYGVWSYSIFKIAKEIKEFQQYHNTTSTKEAQKILYSKLISDSVNKHLQEALEPIQKACNLVNSVSDNQELECLTVICFLISQTDGITEAEIVNRVKWFSEEEIKNAIQRLYDEGMLTKNPTSYNFSLKVN